MSTRRALHKRDDVSNSESPTRTFNQTANKSPQCAKMSHENSANCSSTETQSESDAEAEYKSPTISARKGYQPLYTPESTTKASPRHRPEKPESPKPTLQQPPPSNGGKSLDVNYKYVFYVIIILLSLLGAQMLRAKPLEPQEPVWKKCSFDALRQQRPLQSPEVWIALKTNIELLLNKLIQSPNVYLLLHSDQDRGEKLQKLIHDIALETSKCFDGQRLIEMGLQDFETQEDDDYGYPIEQYKNKLEQGNVFLIVNLNDIPLNAARALHTICDTYSPIAPDVVIFLTLHTDLPTADGIGPTQLAINTLNKLWSEIPDHELGALITRVTDQVLLMRE